MKLAFYKYSEDFNPYGGLIRWWTDSDLSHVELVFSDGISWSSSAMDKGIRFKAIDYSHPERWEFVELPIGEKEEKAIRLKCQLLASENSGYSYRGILGFLLDPIKNDDKFFCSEACLTVLQYQGYFKPFRADKTHPFRLYQLVVSTLNTFEKLLTLK